MRNKIIKGIVILIIAASLVACGKQNNNVVSNNTNKAKSNETLEYHDEKIEKLVIDTLKNKFKFDSVEIEKATVTHEYNNGIDGGSHKYYFTVKADDVTYTAKYISLSKELVADKWIDSSLTLHDDKDIILNPNDLLASNEITETNKNATETDEDDTIKCFWDKKHIDMPELTDELLDKYKLNWLIKGGMGSIKIYKDSEIESITINGITFDYDDLIASFDDIEVALKIARNAKYLQTEGNEALDAIEYSDEEFIDFYNGLHENQFYRKWSNLYLIFDYDKNLLGGATMTYTFGSKSSISVFQESKFIDGNLYKAEKHIDYYITCKDGTLIHPITKMANDEGPVATYLPFSIYDENYQKDLGL